MPKKTGVEQELGDGHEESLDSTEVQNNLHTTEHPKRMAWHRGEHSLCQNIRQLIVCSHVLYL